ncbi:MAG: VanZ family protein [Clostridia bacterium]|nr:VanZ family protein [Clostridia bacterium]
MSLRKKKRIAVLLYVLYATFVTLLIIFGGDVSRAVATFVQNTLDKVNITDVVTSVTEDDVLMAGKYQYVTYTSYGDIRGDDGLEFESLTPEYLTVSDRGRLLASADFEGQFLLAKVRITSKYDDDFEKIVTFKFTKQYPKEFDCAYFVKGQGHAVKTLYVGVPVYAFSHVPAGASTYNVKTYDLEYDERYFDKREDGALVPKAATPEGEKLTFTVRYDNGASESSSEFVIAERASEPESFDTIKLGNSSVSSEEFVATRGYGFILLLEKDGQYLPTDYTITCEGENVYLTSAGHPYFKSVGNKEVTITLPNGFSKTFTIKVRNGISVPYVTDEAVKESHYIKMLDTDVMTYNVKYTTSPITYEKMKFEYDESMVKITSSGRSFTITPKNHGTTTFKLVIDDGYTRVEDTYTLEIEENKDILAIIWKDVSLYVSKVIGHIGLFATLAIVSMYMFRYVYIVDPAARFAAYVMTALPIAAITEIAQTFIPGRYGKIQDVLIDMAGFFLGTLFVIVLNKIIMGIMRRKAKTDKKRKDSMKTLRSSKGLNIAK